MKRILWGTIIIFLFLAGCGTDSESGNPTLPGADEIYPMVMVEGSLYEWRRGRAVLDNLPDSAEYVAAGRPATGEGWAVTGGGRKAGNKVGPAPWQSSAEGPAKSASGSP